MTHIFRRANGRGGFWQSQMILGLLTAGFGIAILVFPQLLQALVAGVFMLMGFFLILSALTLKRVQGSMKQTRKDIFDV